MAAISGLASAVAWTGYAGLYASPGYVAPYAFTLDVPNGLAVTTAMPTVPPAIVRTAIPTAYSWGGSITCRAPFTAASGTSGSVVWATDDPVRYDTAIREWSLDISWGEKDVTAFTGVNVVAKTWIPLLASWRGSFVGFLDDTVPTTLPCVPGYTTLGSLELQLQDTTTDDTLTGQAIVTQLSAAAGVEGTGDVTYSFEGTGQLTAAGVAYAVDNSGIFAAAGTIITPTAGSLVLTAAAGKTFTGNAFPTRVSWRVGVTSGIECVIQFCRTCALVIA
jgi:hypothetical protein